MYGSGWILREVMYFPVNTRVYRQKHNLVHLAMMNAEELIKTFKLLLAQYICSAPCVACVWRVCGNETARRRLHSSFAEHFMIVASRYGLSNGLSVSVIETFKSLFSLNILKCLCYTSLSIPMLNISWLLLWFFDLCLQKAFSTTAVVWTH